MAVVNLSFNFQFIQREKSDVAEVPHSLMGRSQSADVSTEKSSRKAKLVAKSHSTSHVISKCEFKKEPSFQKRNRYDDTGIFILFLDFEKLYSYTIVKFKLEL